jgi:hypothetical protein
MVAESRHSKRCSQKAIRRAKSNGWGGRDRTSEWRNQNQLDCSTISGRIWKKDLKSRLAISIACQLFPNDGVIPFLQHLGAAKGHDLKLANGPKCSRAAAAVLKPVIPRVRPWKLSARTKISACPSGARDNACLAHPTPRRLRRAKESHRAARSCGR